MIHWWWLLIQRLDIHLGLIVRMCWKCPVRFYHLLPQQDPWYSVFNQRCVRGFVHCFTLILKTLIEFGTYMKSEADSLIAATTSYFLQEDMQNLSVAHDAVLHMASPLTSPWRGEQSLNTGFWAESCGKRKQHSLQEFLPHCLWDISALSVQRHWSWVSIW